MKTDKSTKKALFIICAINSVLVAAAIIAGIIVACTAVLSLEIYLPVFAACAIAMITGNILLWAQILRQK